MVTLTARRSALLRRHVVWAAAVAMLCVRTVSAQPAWEDRAFIDVNLGLALASQPFVETSTPIIYDERASLVTAHDPGTGFIKIDLAGGVRVWGHLGVGAGYTTFNTTETATVTAHVPHPTRFGQPRSATADAPFEHTESAIHVQAIWMLPITERIDLAFSGGPSWVTVKQDLVAGIAIEETSPTFATVAISKVMLVNQSDTVIGFNAGADATYFLTPMVGVGLTFRYIAGSVEFPQASGGSVGLDAGGLQLGVGIRIRFR